MSIFKILVNRRGLSVLCRVAVLSCVLCSGLDAQVDTKTALVLRLEEGQVSKSDELTKASNRAQHWRNRLNAHGYKASIRDSETLPRTLTSFDLVVLPGASRSLFPEEREWLLDYVAHGGSIILTQDAGLNLDPSSESVSLASELGLDYQVDLYDQINSWLVLMDQPSILSANVPRMQNFAVQSKRPVFVESAVDPIAFWLDPRIDPPDYKSSAKQTAMTYGIYGSGRFFWMGFPIDGVGGDLESSEAFHRLLGNLFDFFNGMPVAEIAPWPYPHKATTIFSMDVVQQFGNIRRVFELPNLPPFTYFILTNQAELYVETLREISKYEKADQDIALHGNNHDVFKGQPFELQYERFEEAKESITRITGSPPSGFRPPEEAYDFFTIHALLKSGYSYMLADHSPRAAIPKINRNWAQPSIIEDFDEILVQFNIHNKDDVKIVLGNDWPTPDETFQMYVEDFEQIRLREGLYIANINSHILASEKYIDVFKRVIDHIDSHDPWLANCRQVAKWWRDKERLVLTHFRRDSNNLIFGIENNSGELIEGLCIDVWMPYAPESVTIETRPELIISSVYEVEGNRMRLKVEPLEADGVREYHISWHASN